MSLLSLIGFKNTLSLTGYNAEMPEIFPMPMLMTQFVELDVQNIYTRILTDVLERTEGIPDEKQKLLWDNCVASEVPDGLVTLVAKAMAAKSDLFLVYDQSVDVIRKATFQEQEVIRAGYKKEGKSAAGTFITFKNYQRTDMVKLYSALEYCAVSGLYKTGNLSKAIQIKLNDMRASVGAGDATDFIAQASAIAKGLAAGRDVAIDGKDTIETAKPDTTALSASMDLIAQKRSFYLGLPAAYITGVSNKGMGDTGMGESRAIERGLKNYFYAIVKPLIEAVFTIKVTFESEDFDQLSTALEALKTFDVTSNDHLGAENKTIVINKLFGLPVDTEGDAPVKPVVPPAPPNAPVPAAAPASNGPTPKPVG